MRIAFQFDTNQPRQCRDYYACAAAVNRCAEDARHDAIKASDYLIADGRAGVVVKTQSPRATLTVLKAVFGFLRYETAVGS